MLQDNHRHPPHARAPARGPSSGAFAQRPLAVPGARSTIASGINDAGTIIVGAYIDTSGRDHGFLWHGSGITPSTSRARWTPKPSESMRPAPVSWACTRTPAARPTAFCGRGQLPPSTSRARGAPEPSGSMRPAPSSWADTRTPAARTTALCGRGSFTALDVPGARGTRALGINAAGTIVVGMYTDSSGTEHGFVWQGAASPPSSTSQARGHPGLGDQCGWHHHRGLVQGHQRHGPRILWRGSFTPFDFPGARSTQALGINAAGTIIVGMYADSSDAWFCHTLMKGEFGHIFNQNRACDFCKPMILLALHTKHAAPCGRTLRMSALRGQPVAQLRHTCLV